MNLTLELDAWSRGIRQTLNLAKFVDLLAPQFFLANSKRDLLVWIFPTLFADTRTLMENLNLIMNSLYNSRRSLSLRSISSRQQGTEIYDKSCRSLTRAAAAIKSRRASGSSSPIQRRDRSFPPFLSSFPPTLPSSYSRSPSPQVDWCSADITWKRDHSKHCYGRRLRAQ